MPCALLWQRRAGSIPAHRNAASASASRIPWVRSTRSPCERLLAAVAPGIVLTFDTVSRPVDLEDNLRDGVVDIAIDWLPVELDPFVNRKLFDDRLVLLAQTRSPLSRC